MEKLNKKQVWNDCLESIKVSVSPAIYSTWFSQTHLVSLVKKGERYLGEIGCSSTFVKNTIENRYFGLIQGSLTKSIESPCDVYFTIKENPNLEKINQENLPPLFKKTEDNKKNQLKNAIEKARIRPFFKFENFAVSSSNQMAWAASKAVSDNPGTAYNPLFIWGGVGVGKTHLMNAVGLEIIKKDINKKVFFCSGEEFTNEIVEGIRNKTTPKFRNKYRKLDILLIDDIQFIAGKDAIQEEFFHTFNAIVSSGGQIILTSDRPPSDISKLEERLRSRFEAGLIVDVSQPNFELRCAIIQIKSKEKGLNIPMDLVQLIAGNVDSARKIEGILIRILTEMSVKKLDNVNEDLITTILGKGIEENHVIKTSPKKMIDVISKYFQIGKRNLLGKTRMRKYAFPRQILMYLLRTQLNLPLEEVGRLIGGRDHTTVMHAVDKITTLASTNVDLREDIKGIKNML